MYNNMKKYHVVYWAYNSILKLSYIGCKSFDIFSEFEKYNTSSSNNKYIIQWFNNRLDAEKYERELQIKLKVIKSKKFVNSKLNNIGLIKNNYKSWNKGLKGENNPQSGKNHPCYGKRSNNADNNLYVWLKKDKHQLILCNRQIIGLLYNIDISGVTKLVKGKRKSLKGIKFIKC